MLCEVYIIDSYLIFILVVKIYKIWTKSRKGKMGTEDVSIHERKIYNFNM